MNRPSNARRTWSFSRIREAETLGDAAVSDVLGTVLLVGITVVVAGVLLFVIFRIPGPVDHVNSNVTIAVDRGAGGWGTGDERVTVTHTGGETILRDAAKITVKIGATTNTYVGAGGLTQGFSDGKFKVGETWTQTYTIGAETSVTVNLISDTTDGGAMIVATNSVTPTCLTDTTPPVVSLWAQNPADVRSTTSGGVVVTATVEDGCSGVDATVNPSLRYRVNDGSNPAYSNAGAMTPLGGLSWQVTIPDQTWANQGGKNLQYYASGMKDLRANVGDGAVRTELIEAAVTYSYVTSNTVTTGTVTNFANAQSGSDSNAVATLTEANTGSSSAPDRYGTTNAGTGTNTNEADGAPDDVYATLADDGAYARIGGFATTTGTITKVEIAFEGKYTGAYSNDYLRLAYRISGTTGSTLQDISLTSTDATTYKDVTADRAWTWTDITNMDVQGTFNKNGGEDSIDIQVDALWIRVTYTTLAYAMSIRMDTTGVPAGTNHDLELRYKTTGDTYRVDVYDGAAWNARGATLSAALLTGWTYALTAAEYNSGAPAIRVIDLTPAGTTQGTLDLEYVRVKTT